MITAASLQAKSLKDLGKIANRVKVSAWRSLKKDQLVKAIVRATQKQAKASPKATKAPQRQSVATKKTRPTAMAGKAQTLAAAKKTPDVKSKPKPPSKVQQKIQVVRAERERQKNLSAVVEPANGHEVAVRTMNGKGHATNGSAKAAKAEVARANSKRDRITLLVRDAYWLQCVWELTRQSVERAQVALAQQWHTAKPVLRLMELESNSTTSTVEQVARVIGIHGGVNTWFIDVHDSPKNFRIDIGYMAANGKFFALARSNSISTPRPGSSDGIENNWSDIANDCEKIYALSGGFSDESTTGELQEAFEERLGRPMGGPAGTRYGVGADKVFSRRNEFQFEVDAEMIIFGRSRPNARVTLAGNPIRLRPDGSFAARLAMPDRRQVLPVVASSADGIEQRTVVIAVERNTKVMEPMVRESSE